MLSEDAKLVVEFVEECRIQGTIKDELYNKLEDMYSVFYHLEDLAKESKEKEMFSQLGSLIFDVLKITKETYFSYGENYAQVQADKLLKKLKEA